MLVMTPIYDLLHDPYQTIYLVSLVTSLAVIYLF